MLLEPHDLGVVLRFSVVRLLYLGISLLTHMNVEYRLNELILLLLSRLSFRETLDVKTSFLQRMFLGLFHIYCFLVFLEAVD